MITLYGFGSPNVLKVLIMLEELRLPWRFEEVDVFKGDQFTPAFEALNPNNKVPVIVDDEGLNGSPLTLWESGAILIYLAEKTGRFLPSDPFARLNTLQWLMFQMAGVGPMFGQHSHFKLYAPQEEHAYARTRYTTEAKRLYDVVEKRLQQSEYLGSNDYSIADIAAWPWMYRAEKRGVDIEALPATKRWINAISKRPAVQKAKAFFDPMTNIDVAKVMDERPDDVDRYVMRGRYARD